MTAMARDAWSDAHQAATQEVLDRDLARVRRRIWLRRALGLVLAGAALLATSWVLLRRLGPDDDVRLVPLGVVWVGFGLMGLGLVVMAVGGVRSFWNGETPSFVGPDAFLSRADRAWLRTQIAEGRPVPEERRAVVTDAAHRMVVEGRMLAKPLGVALIYVGLMITSPTPTFLVTFSVLTVWMLISATRTAIWAHRARRWLAQNP